MVEDVFQGAKEKGISLSLDMTERRLEDEVDGAGPVDKMAAEYGHLPRDFFHGFNPHHATAPLPPQ